MRKSFCEQREDLVINRRECRSRQCWRCGWSLGKAVRGGGGIGHEVVLEAKNWWLQKPDIWIAHL